MKIQVLQIRERGKPFPRRNEPVRVGVPIPQGVCPTSDRATLRNPQGRRVAVQARALDRWNDGSVRWLLVDFLADHDGRDAAVEYELGFASEDTAAMSLQRSLTATFRGDDLTIDTGAAWFGLRRNGRFPFEEAFVDGVPAADIRRTGVELDTDDGHTGYFRIADIAVEDAGPVRAVVRLDGWIRQGKDEKFVRAVADLHFVVDSATVRFELTLGNPRRAEHRGGFWELGDRGSVHLRDVSFTVALPPGSDPLDIRCSPEIGAPFDSYQEDLELYQDSSGGPNWNSVNHLDRERRIPLRVRGYRLCVGGAGGSNGCGLRATPIVSMTRKARQLSLTMPDFWQNFPKAMEATGDRLCLRLLPRQHAVPHELQGGEQKTHVFFVAFDRDRVSDVPLDWARDPLLVRMPPAHYCASGAVPYLIASAEDDPSYSSLVNAAVEGDDTFEQKREVIDEYGWRNFGELYADHEAVFGNPSAAAASGSPFEAGRGALISHYNNQYDAIAGLALQFMRSGDARWWRLCADLAAHVKDIDIYHTDLDKAAYNHALFWHTYHYVDVGLATHRAYPRAERVGGGGPSNEHNYSKGLLLHYFLTGDARSRDAVVALARWVIDMDDGAKTVFRWLTGGDTGLASQTASPLYHGPGRGGGNSIRVLLDGHLLTGARLFLDKAEALIRRCVHPADDLDARNLLDPESRWSYTVFLHALGVYLDYKAERKEVDTAYGYAREALLAYARWMAVREEPYLDHPEKLEYPTETWAAQEMWKSEVFNFAAKHAAAEERAQFLERADFFFRYSISTLGGMKTRTLTRPVVLLLSHGYMTEYVRKHADALVAPRPSATVDFGAPAPFVPQKVRARKRFIAAVAAGALVTLGCAAYLVVSLF